MSSNYGGNRKKEYVKVVQKKLSANLNILKKKLTPDIKSMPKIQKCKFK